MVSPNTGDLNKLQVSSSADARDRVSILGSAACPRAFDPASAIWTNQEQGPAMRH